MDLVHRAATPADFEAYFRACFTNFGYGPEPPASVLYEWDVLMNNPTSLSMVVEDRDRPPHDRSVGIAQMVFVSEVYMQWAKTEMPPYTNIYATQPLPDGSRPLLTPGEVRAANSREGLNALISQWGWAEPPLTPDQGRIVRDYLDRSFSLFAGGYNLKEMIIGVVGQGALQMALNSGFVLRSDHRAYRWPPGAEPPSEELWPYLLSITREEARAQEGTRISRAFLYKPPKCYFGDRERELLRLAVRDFTDDQISEELCIGKDAVKKRWLNIFARVAYAVPNLLPDVGADGTRGKEKRRVLLAYLREHLEELTPVEPPPGWAYVRECGPEWEYA